MHQKQQPQLHQIGKESIGLFPDSDSHNPAFFLPIHPKHAEIQTQNDALLKIHTTSQSSQPCPSQPSSTATHQNFNHTQIQNEPICNNPSMNKTLLSSPQKRRIMSQTPSASSLQYYHKTNVLNSEPCNLSVLCFSSISVVALATKPILLRLSRYLCCVRCVGVHFRFIILFSLPSLYFFTSNLSNNYSLYLLSILAFSATLVISLNLVLPRLLSINLPSKSTASNPSPPVVWSIGSKPESEKRLRSGFGVKVYSNGDMYEGEFRKGKCSGSGVYYYYMSGRYEGDCVGDKYDGYGVETWAKGSRYRGQYQQGLRHGFGIYRFYTGDVYAGEWCNGQCHGCGIYTCEDGSKYVGEFKWGVKHGLGHYHFRNGDKYAGEYFSDKMHGFGVYHFGNGHCYEGAWHEGRRQGLGMYTFRNGDTQSGHWQNGVLNVPSVEDKLPGSSLAICHRKVLSVVQESRQASMKAVNLAPVDERVKKAVAAANKAANAARVAAVKAVQSRMHQNSCHNDLPLQIV